MPTVKQIDSYIEERVVRTWNNRPLYQLVIKINSITDAVSYYDTGDLLADLDSLIMIQGIGYISQISDWKVYSDRTLDIKLSYDKVTRYLKVELNNYSSVTNNSINFYYVKDEGTVRSSLQQAEEEYHPVMDVYVNGQTVLDENRIAQIKSYKEISLDEYNNLPETKLHDDIMYCIKGDFDDPVDEVSGVLDVKINGESIVDNYGIANITDLVTQMDLALKQDLLVAGSNITLTPLEDGTVRISAIGGGSSGTVTDVTVNGNSVVSGTVAVILVPTKTSDLTNDSGFIDNTVSNLTNYYNKAATDNRIDTKIDAIPIATTTDKGLMSAAQATTVANAVTGVRVNGISVVDINRIANIDIVHIDYESYWNSQTTLIGEAGHIYVYLDHHIKDGILYPAIKIGDGTGYLLGNPFIGDYEAEMLIDHISDTDVHITSAERTFWNNKVTCYMSTVDNENIIFSKN